MRASSEGEVNRPSIRWGLVIINVCVLCLAAILQAESDYITDAQHAHAPLDKQTMFIPVVLAFLARRTWFSCVLLIVFCFPLVRYSYEVWKIRTNVDIRYPLDIHTLPAVVFVGSVLFGVAFAAISVVRLIRTWMRSNRTRG
jgi:hypothetical protein